MAKDKTSVGGFQRLTAAFYVLVRRVMVTTRATLRDCIIRLRVRVCVDWQRTVFALDPVNRIIDHPRSSELYNFGPVCMYVYVCLSVGLPDDHLRKNGHRKFIFAHAVYLQRILVKFVYEGHWVRVKVTGAKKVENSYFRKVKLLSAITPVLSNI